MNAHNIITRLSPRKGMLIVRRVRRIVSNAQAQINAQPANLRIRLLIIFVSLTTV